MKLSKKTWAFLAAFAAMVLFIFSNSLKNAEESMEMSDGAISLLAPLLDFLDGIFGKADWVLIIRKAGHLIEFAALGTLCHCFLFCLESDTGKTFVGFGLFACLMTAVLDEFIQRYTGRTSSVLDILIDLTGALLGFVLVWLWRLLRRRKAQALR